MTRRRIHSSKWDINDHVHICLAARLLEKDDFVAVCPCGGRCEIEFDDVCDECEYMARLDFCSDMETKWLVLQGICLRQEEPKL